MGLKAIQPKEWKGGKRKDHPVHPYRLENLVISGPNQVWGTDITYILTRYGWVYLVAIMDLYSRMILDWRPWRQSPVSSSSKTPWLNMGRLRF